MENQNLCNHCLDYTLGEIRDELLNRRYERHLETCIPCQNDVSEYQDILDSLQTDSMSLQAIGFPKRTDECAKVIAFPRERVRSRPKMGHKLHTWSQRGTLFSITFTVAAMMLALLVHTGNVKHVAVLGDSAFDHVTHTVRSDSSHIKRDFIHIYVRQV